MRFAIIFSSSDSFNSARFYFSISYFFSCNKSYDPILTKFNLVQSLRISYSFYCIFPIPNNSCTSLFAPIFFFGNLQSVQHPNVLNFVVTNAFKQRGKKSAACLPTNLHFIIIIIARVEFKLLFRSFSHRQSHKIELLNGRLKCFSIGYL